MATKPLIMIVAENNLAMAAFQNAAERSGYRVEMCSGNRDYFPCIVEHAPVIVIIDCQKPEREGFSLCRRLMIDPETTAVQVIIIASATDERHANLAHCLGAALTIIPPMKAAEFVEKIRTIKRPQVDQPL